jgi:ABC-type sugar transport system ATPase subunit
MEVHTKMSSTEAGATAAPSAPSSTADVILDVQHVSKAFGAIVALADVSLQLRRGEVLGLVGDNGAGKSTLAKIICGFHQPDSGKILLEGKEIQLHSVQDARRHGIDTVYQDLALVPQLPVYANLYLGRESTVGGPLHLLARSKMRRVAREYLRSIKVNLPNVDADVETLSGGQRQAVAVARATRSQVKVLLLDEPLAAMGARESSLIIDLIKDLASRGQSMIVVDHNYTHLFELCDRLAVLQDGVITFDKLISETSLQEMTDYMVSEYRNQLGTGRTERVNGANGP